MLSLLSQTETEARSGFGHEKLIHRLTLLDFLASL